MLRYSTEEAVLELKQKVTILALVILLSYIVLAKGTPKQIYSED